jgi:hypothetical protein
MRLLLLLFIVALPTLAQAGEAARTAAAWKALREHQLLSRQQHSCTYLLERDGSTDRLVKVGVYEIHDARCGGDPDVTHRLFDLELDRRSGVLRWDDNPEQEMRRVPVRRRR